MVIEKLNTERSLLTMIDDSSSISSSTTLSLIDIEKANHLTTISTNIINDHNKRPSNPVFPTVSPESIIIPIISCILGLPLLALFIICCLRRRAKLARERDRRRNYDLQDHAVSLVRFSPIHRLTGNTARAISFRSERSLSRGFPSLELDTVIEERSDPDQIQADFIMLDSPNFETTKKKFQISYSNNSNSR